MEKFLLAGLAIVIVFILLAARAHATDWTTVIGAISRVSVNPDGTLLPASFDPNAPVGGVPFCFSRSLGTIICYPPSFLKTAYNFPSAPGDHGLDGSGSTIVIVDAFGSPTIQSDLNLFDTTFGLSASMVKILCGPT